MIVVLKSFLINFILPKHLSNGWEKAIIDNSPILSDSSFQIRNRLSSCIRNQLLSCSLRNAFQSKSRLSSLFKFKEVFLNTFARILFVNVRVVATTQLIMVKLIASHERRSMGITPLTQKRFKNAQKSAIMDHIFLEGHHATYDDFFILIPNNNQFKLYLKESLSEITDRDIVTIRDNRELNRNTPIPWRFLHDDSSYYNVYNCIIRIIALTISCFYEDLDNSSSL